MDCGYDSTRSEIRLEHKEQISLERASSKALDDLFIVVQSKENKMIKKQEILPSGDRVL